MDGELLAILEHIEREKGIKRETLIQAVESALVSAARKVIEVKPEEKLKVELDRKTGLISAFIGEKKIDSVKFGRIAAQTAKQVIIQKIREAEKEVIYDEFSQKIGQILTGTVYRFEKGNIIVDLLGKTEGILSRREQVQKEEFRQGERIRAYCLEVNKGTKGAQIILSRAHPNMVKKLFELEVPEIYEGVVEIKSIAREPGERTKISVWSKDEKVDCVGACVGMKGSRVKNIVSELQGEKIDIVRYNDDIKEYITNSLSPAKISEIRLDKTNHKALILVETDQLSLAIGKHGQNVRLASRLTNWGLDIRTREQLLEKIELPGIGEKIRFALIEAGFDTYEKISKADLKDLAKIKGIGKKKAEKLIEEAKKKVNIV